MNHINKDYYNPVLIIGYKDHPVNQFFAEVIVNSQSRKFIFSYTVEGAIERGLEEYRKAVEQQGRGYIFDKKDWVV